MSNKTTSAYIHIPFCLAKCTYCDFLSFPLRDGDLPPEVYLPALTGEMACRGAMLKEEKIFVNTVYIGGGTPTVLPAGDLDRLLAGCRDSLPLDQAEWTVEANPDTLDGQKIKLLADCGVNRISVGVQDISDARLRILGRTYTNAAARETVALCKKYFSSVSVDIMSGLPTQSAGEFIKTLREICAWEPDHISVYGLKTEETTPLAGQIELGLYNLPSEEEQLTMLLRGSEILQAAGFIHYEIANFARPGHFCRHNLNYWNNRPFLGMGLGAHSFWRRSRQRNYSEPALYLDSLKQGLLPVAEDEAVSGRQEMEDTMMLGLRLLEGVDFQRFLRRFGCDARDIFAAAIDGLSALGLVICDDKRIRLSHRGFPLANLVFSEFLSV